ncbi:MAG: hypothetical protein AABX93_00105 [Nanoarchaeota archaeon]
MQIKKEQKPDEMKREFVKDAISTVIGKQGEEIVNFLDPDKYINEFLVAKKLDLNINQTRNLLYKLSEHSLVSSTRKKDKKKGWYTYFWKLETLRILEFLRDILKKKIEQISNQIESREMKTFYICERCNIEYNEENALLHDFTCNECGSVFAVKDNSKVVREFKKNLEKLQNEISIIDGEIRGEKDKGDKRKFKEIKKEENEKIRKRLEKKKERDLLKKKEGTLKVKKPAKKTKAKKIKKKKTSKKKK